MESQSYQRENMKNIIRNEGWGHLKVVVNSITKVAVIWMDKKTREANNWLDLMVKYDLWLELKKELVGDKYVR